MDYKSETAWGRQRYEPGVGPVVLVLCGLALLVVGDDGGRDPVRAPQHGPGLGTESCARILICAGELRVWEPQLELQRVCLDDVPLLNHCGQPRGDIRPRRPLVEGERFKPHIVRPDDRERFGGVVQRRADISSVVAVFLRLVEHHRPEDLQRAEYVAKREAIDTEQTRWRSGRRSISTARVRCWRTSAASGRARRRPNPAASYWRSSSIAYGSTAGGSWR
jgi:hypothetical protein